MLSMTKNLTVAGAVAMVFAGWGPQAQAATADASSANVVITATVTAKTCTPGWSATDGVKVDLGKVASSDMANKGDIGALKPFTLALTDCDAGVTNVEVTSSGNPDSTDTDAFANGATGDNAATGVAVTLFGGPSQNTQLTPSSKNAVTYPVNATTHAVDMMFMAKLENSGLKDGITAGNVSSNATLYMTYE